MSEQSTPGPWHVVVIPDDDRGRYYVHHPRGAYLAEVFHMGCATHANARLMSAAPALAAALQALLDRWNRCELCCADFMDRETFKSIGAEFEQARIALAPLAQGDQ